MHRRSAEANGPTRWVGLVAPPESGAGCCAGLLAAIGYRWRWFQSSPWRAIDPGPGPARVPTAREHISHSIGRYEPDRTLALESKRRPQPIPRRSPPDSARPTAKLETRARMLGRLSSKWPHPDIRPPTGFDREAWPPPCRTTEPTTTGSPGRASEYGRWATSRPESARFAKPTSADKRHAALEPEDSAMSARSLRPANERRVTSIPN